VPDFTMCSGGACPRKMGCYRFTANPGPMQSFFVDPPFDGDRCEYLYARSVGTLSAPSRPGAEVDEYA